MMGKWSYDYEGRKCYDQGYENGRKGMGVELKPTYYRQAVKNIEAAYKISHKQQSLFDAAN